MKDCGCSKNMDCGCCAGVEPLTPNTTVNRPGLSVLGYRIGTHSAFFETMQARLTSFGFKDADDPSKKINPLLGLTTRQVSDPSIAVLSGAAVMLDVLTFYQERIVNEGFLRTATERRSVLELGRLVGYTPRPGVSASVYLAYTLDDNSEPAEIPAGARAQSIPAQDELPQSFETSEKLEARKEWNDLRPRLSEPQRITFDDSLTIETLYFEGTETKLKTSDPLLLVFEDASTKKTSHAMRRVQTVTPESADNRTRVSLQVVPGVALNAMTLMDNLLLVLKDVPEGEANHLANIVKQDANIVKRNIWLGSYPRNVRSEDIKRLLSNLNVLVRHSDGNTKEKLEEIAKQLIELADGPVVLKKPEKQQTSLRNLAKSLLIPASLQPANSSRLVRSIQKVYNPNSDISGQLLVNFNPTIADSIYSALSKATVSVVQPELQAVYALRVTAPVFGYNAPKLSYTVSNSVIVPTLPVEPVIANEFGDRVFLDSAYDKITASDENKISYIVINRGDAGVTQTFEIRDAQIDPRTEYGVSSKTTSLTLDRDWWNPIAKESSKISDDFDAIRQTITYADSEQLILTENPIDDDVFGEKIELGELYDGLQAGRWIIVCGERADIEGAEGIITAELAMLAGVEQSFKPGDKMHTTLLLAGQNNEGEKGLQYTYRRKTVKIYGNVVKATHGETRNEVLGSGDATQNLQAFVLKQPPLTYVSAPTTSGIESTLEVRVNDIEWHETDSLAGLNANDRKFITKTDDEGKTTVVFGNGEKGARPPTGTENIQSVYRNGIGKGGNVKAEQISLLMTKPLGVKEVINPLRATGGADKETRDQARRNVPVALMALDRLVSTSDYADFARTFAGIGKSSASRLSDGYRQVVHLTIAGADDIPIDKNSDLYINLRRSLSKYGDPYQAVKVVTRELIALVIAARVSIHADYLWESVATKIRKVLVDTFSFERRELGQTVFLSEVISAIQSVEGVAYSDLDVLEGLSETDIADEDLMNQKLEELNTEKPPNQYVRAELAGYVPNVRPPLESISRAQMAYLLPDVPDTLILNQIEEVKK